MDVAERAARRRAIMATFVALVLATIYAAVAVAALLLDGAPWLVWAASCATLMCVSIAAAVVTAWHTRHSRGVLGPEPPRLPPERYSWAPPGPDRPTGQRPGAPVRYQCPVQPGMPEEWPRTVADLRRWPPEKQPDLRSWE